MTLEVVCAYPLDLQELSLETDSPALQRDHEFSETNPRFVSDVHVSPGMTSSA